MLLICCNNTIFEYHYIQSVDFMEYTSVYIERFDLILKF